MLDIYLRSYLEDLRWTLEEVDRSQLGAIVELLQRARDAGRQILVIGNGGSAATASHMACDLGKGTVDFSNPEFKRFRVLSLCDNNALITAIGNDLSYEDVFVEQLRMVLRPEDVVVLISASGNSPNVVKAAEYAREMGATTVALLGFGGGKLRRLVDYPVVVSSRNYGIAEDFHAAVQHVLTQYLRRALAGPARPVAFLDRDGVINERAAPHEYIEHWSQFRFVEGVLPTLRILASLGYELVVVTNQQGIGRGKMSAEGLARLHVEMTQALDANGIRLAGIFHCPHLESDGCFCRKPRPGLLQRALNEMPFLVDMERSLLIGDTDADVEAGRAMGLRTICIAGPDGSGAGATHVVSRIEEVVGVLGVSSQAAI